MNGQDVRAKRTLHGRFQIRSARRADPTQPSATIGRDSVPSLFGHESSDKRASGVLQLSGRKGAGLCSFTDAPPQQTYAGRRLDKCCITHLHTTATGRHARFRKTV